MKFGMCMDGMEEAFEQCVRDIASKRDSVTYVEIGIYRGETLRAVCDILQDTGKAFEAYGIDPNPQIEGVIPAQALVGRSDEILNNWLFPIDLCLIDGDHSFESARNDFLLIEPHITHGGIVLFHDTSPVQQNGQDLDVIRALESLDLWSNSRPGWEHLPDWNATGPGWNMSVFQFGAIHEA